MRGTGFVVGEIILWLTAAAAIGAVVGWLVRAWRGDARARADADARVAAEKGHVTGLETRLAAAKSRAEDLEGKLTDANVQTTDLTTRVEALTADLAGAAADAEFATVELEAKLANEQEASSSKIAGLMADLDGATARSGELEATAAAISNLEAQLAERSSRLESATARIGSLEAALETANREAADRGEELAKAREAAESGDQVGAAAGGFDTPDSVESEAASTQPVIDEMPDRDAAAAKVAQIVARTRGDGPAVDDDLKKIHGVGPMLERLLNSMGITSFDQVAQFEPDDIAYVTAALDAFPGRIEWDDWMTSAAEQRDAKYG